MTVPTLCCDVSCMFFQANNLATYNNTPIHPCTLEQYTVKQQMEKKSKIPETLEKKFNIVISFAWVTLFYKSTTGNTVISYQHRVFCSAVYCLKIWHH